MPFGKIESDIIIVSAAIFNVLAIVGVYKIFQVEKIWIKLYVALLLLMMGAVSLFQSRKERPYRPRRMVLWASLAGFNKGVGGGGYGPVVTIGGLLAGVPVKSMLAVTAHRHRRGRLRLHLSNPRVPDP